MNKKELYLPEDEDIYTKLEENLNNIYARESSVENLKTEIEGLKIKASLRSRKTMVDLDESNKRYSLVILFLTIMQIIIAGIQLSIEAYSFKDPIYIIILIVIMISTMFFFYKKIEKNKQISV